ncbi:hypothetical protein [Streptomyces sp. SM14]|uniref:hypothetical protein n=1 Tax=Streptomyces sp. SM14 TaxID=1736045 RepID=UPI000CD51938|nr:hypothetical protein [Streptomyces sp. SM14]
MTIDHITRAQALMGAAAVALLLAAIALGTARARRRRRQTGAPRARVTLAQAVATVAALICTGVGAHIAWEYARDHVGIDSTAERGALFLAGEVILLGLALLAREEMQRSGRPGLPGTLVWAITAFLMVPAAYVSDDIGSGLWRIVLGPLGAAVMWHMAMGIEMRRETGREGQGVLAVAARRVRERILARLGADASAEEIARDRALWRAAALVDRYAALDPKGRTGRRGRRLARRIKVAMRTARVADQPELRERLVAIRAVDTSLDTLAQLTPPSPWETGPAVAEQAVQPVHTPVHTAPVAPALEAPPAPEPEPTPAPAPEPVPEPEPEWFTAPPFTPEPVPAAPAPEPVPATRPAPAPATFGFARQEPPASAPEPEPTPADADRELLRLWREGASTRAAGAEVELSASTVSKRFRAFEKEYGPRD